MKFFYARTSNTGLTTVVFCLLVQHKQPILFGYVMDVRAEIRELYKEYIACGFPRVVDDSGYSPDRIIGFTEAKELIKKYGLTSYSG
jgi:hypothetical protein